MTDIAHLGPVELLTPEGEASLRFFVDVMGMEVEHEDGGSAFLRGWGDYQPWSLRLTESETSGMGAPATATASATPTAIASSSTSSASATSRRCTCARH